MLEKSFLNWAKSLKPGGNLSTNSTWRERGYVHPVISQHDKPKMQIEESCSYDGILSLYLPSILIE